MYCVPWLPAESQIIRSLIGRCFRGFVLPVLEYCSAVWCSAADTHIKLLDRAVSDARFLTGSVFECDIAHRRTVTVLCMLYKIRCNPMHPLNDALPGPYVPVRGTHGALVAHWYTYAPPRCKTLQYRMTFIHISVSLWNKLADPVFDGGTGGFGEQGQCFFICLSCSIHTSTIFPFLFFLSIGWCFGARVFGLMGCISISLSLALPASFNNNNNNNNNKIYENHSMFYLLIYS